MTGRFEGARVVVTGASRGLGASLARAFGAEGARVAVCCRARREDAEAVAASVRELGGAAEVWTFDLADGEATLAAIADIEARWGGVDILVANGAAQRLGPFLTEAPEDFDEVVAANLLGAARLARAVARGMVARGEGRIVLVGSVAALRALPGQASYAVSKAGLHALARSLAAELAGRGVRVNALVPGVLEGGMAARAPRAAQERLAALVPAGRVGRFEELAAAALFLASDAASYIHGHALVVDGGLSL